MKKQGLIFWVVMLGSLFSQAVFAQPFTVSALSPIQTSMVAGSSQQISYVLTNNIQGTTPIVTCTFTPGSSGLTYTLNNAGCTNSNGMAIPYGSPVTIVLTLTVANDATSPQSGTLNIQQIKPRPYPAPAVNMSFNVLSNSSRTVTLTNYCTTPAGAGGSTGNDPTIAITTSSTPAPNLSTSNTACTSDAQCHALSTYSTCLNEARTGPCDGGGNCSCGGGLCITDSDCADSTTGTCQNLTCTYCSATNTCMTGSTCNTGSNSGKGACYFNMPTPGKYRLSAYTIGQQPDSTTISLTDYSDTTGFTQVFNGRVTGRVGCTYSSGGNYQCTVGDCGETSGSPACNLATNSITAPATLAEMTFINRTPDTYDVSLVDGSSMPISVYPTPGNAFSPNAYGNPYICGEAGSITEVQTNGGQQNIGASSWTFTLPTYQNATVYQLRRVDTSTATTCSSDSACQTISSNYLCGLRTDYVSGVNSGQTTCGKFLGYWSFDQLCTANSAFTFKNARGTTIASCTSSTYGGNQYLQLLACSGPAAVSCFNISGSSSTCCGCVNWNTQGITVPTDPDIVAQCNYPNTYWVGSSQYNVPGVLPFLTWAKQACPGCYSYPYDDKTSTYGCPSNNGQTAVNYNIDFCPENKSLTPA